ncbi:hypothetical protein [Pyruvatibacter mobilis]|uniref:hypothetical protein n=1 Tax=Pyruvatibacter mobilis TaxID=1712261 RepID=UPI003BAC14A8
MPLESASYINGLQATNPDSLDGIGQGDDHIRLIKQVLLATFPNLSAPVTATASDLNNTSFVGEVRMFVGDPATLPANWKVADGTNGTINLQDKFLIGAGGTYALNETGGAAQATASTDTKGAHAHGGTTAQHALTPNQIPVHHHFVANTSYAEGALNSGNTLNMGNNVGARADHEEYGLQGGGAAASVGRSSNVGGGGGHGHGITSDGAHDHEVTVPTLPPFHALYFVQRVS